MILSYSKNSSRSRIKDSIMMIITIVMRRRRMTTVSLLLLFLYCCCCYDIPFRDAGTSIFVSALVAGGSRSRSGGGGGGSKQNRNKKRRTTSGSKTNNNNGFGKDPSSQQLPTLQETLNRFHSRRKPTTDGELPCPCGVSPGKLYKDCCGPLHCGDDDGRSGNGHNSNMMNVCTTPLQVLQSRYTAFYFRDIGHIIATTHPECRDYRPNDVQSRMAWAKDMNRGGMFDSFQFLELKVLQPQSTSKTPSSTEEAFLEYQVRLRGREEDDDDDDDDNNASSTSTSFSLPEVQEAVAGKEITIHEVSRFLMDPQTGIWAYAGGDVKSDVAGLEDTTLNN
jgi:SEC-C motif-containing protein